MKNCKILVMLLAAVLLVFSVSPVLAAKPIVIGSPLSTAFLYGWTAERGIRLAIEEINAAGGVNVDGSKRPFTVEVIDTRDLEPGVPVSPISSSAVRFALRRPWRPCPFCQNTRKYRLSPPVC